MAFKEGLRSLALTTAVTLPIAGAGWILYDRTPSPEFRALEGQQIESYRFNILIGNYRDPEDNRIYMPVYRNVPNINGRELTDEDLQERGLTRRGIHTGVRVYGDSGDQAAQEPVKEISADGQREVYHEWYQLGEGVYISANFVKISVRIDEKKFGY